MKNCSKLYEGEPQVKNLTNVPSTYRPSSFYLDDHGWVGSRITWFQRWLLIWDWTIPNVMLKLSGLKCSSRKDLIDTKFSWTLSRELLQWFSGIPDGTTNVFWKLDIVGRMMKWSLELFEIELDWSHMLVERWSFLFNLALGSRSNSPRSAISTPWHSFCNSSWGSVWVVVSFMVPLTEYSATFKLWL